MTTEISSTFQKFCGEFENAKRSLLTAIDLDKNARENTWMWSEDKELQNKIQSRISALTTLSGYLGALKRLHTDYNEWNTEDVALGSNTQKWLDDCNKYKSDSDQTRKEVEAIYEEIASGLQLIKENHLDDKLKELNKKQQELSDLETSLECSAGVFPELQNNRSYNDVIHDLEQDIKKLKEETAAYEVETKRLLKFMDLDYNETLDILHKSLSLKLDEERQIHDQEVKRPSDLSDFYTSLLGGKIISETNCKTVLELQGGSNQVVENEQSDNIIVTLTYNPQRPPHPKLLTDMQFEHCPIATSDLVAMSLRMNDASIALQILRERIQNTQCLVDEINELRDICAIDWLPEDNLLLLIVGKFVCHIEVIDHTNFKLTSVRGHSSVDVETLDVSSENVTLKTYVKKLEEYFLNV